MTSLIGFVSMIKDMDGFQLLFYSQPHQDGPAYFPVVAIISLMSPLVIDFTPHQKIRDQNNDEVKTIEPEVIVSESNGDQKDCSLLLMPCSLVIFKDQAYSGKYYYVMCSALFEFYCGN